jgi:hypothetical protein
MRAVTSSIETRAPVIIIERTGQFAGITPENATPSGR